MADTPINIERLQICTWDFHGKEGAIEIGIEFGSKEWYRNHRNCNSVHFILSLPFLGNEDKVLCLEKTLVGENGATCKFIFNDIVTNTYIIKEEPANGSVIKFRERTPLAIMPIELGEREIGQLAFAVNNLDILGSDEYPTDMSIYVRILIKTKLENFVGIKKGIAKISYLYDMKINEMRNIPDNINNHINQGKNVCKEIKHCFCMHVLPSDYVLSYTDSTKLKNVRILESDAFNRYLSDLHALDDEYVILFQKDQLAKDEQLKSYSFFSVFERERIGNSQVVVAVVVNLICALLIGFSPLKQITADAKWYESLSFGTISALVVVVFLCVWCFLPWSKWWRECQWKRKNKKK